MQMQIVEFTMKNYQNVIAFWKSCEGIGLSAADSKDSMKAYLKRNSDPTIYEAQRPDGNDPL